MATVVYTAKVVDSRTLELPEEANALGLNVGDEIHVFVSQNGPDLMDIRSDEERQKRFRILTTQLFAESDEVERLPETHADPNKATVAEMVAEKHRTIRYPWISGWPRPLIQRRDEIIKPSDSLTCPSRWWAIARNSPFQPS
jgi:hypothetical protein